ncbi:MAG: hypothetical protein SOY49_11405 [Prevotella sp.]|nr:hypothetical protein [Prevotella sp.]
MELNKEIKLPSGKYDVAVLGRDHRILYYKKQKTIIIKSSYGQAMKANADGRAEVLTASQAPRRYPDVFTDSSKSQFEGDTRTIMLRVPQDMYVFCCRQGNITAYLRGLIKKEMECF